jgi:hypothetical protein
VGRLTAGRSWKRACEEGAGVLAEEDDLLFEFFAAERNDDAWSQRPSMAHA